MPAPLLAQDQDQAFYTRGDLFQDPEHFFFQDQDFSTSFLSLSRLHFLLKLTTLPPQKSQNQENHTQFQKARGNTYKNLKDQPHDNTLYQKIEKQTLPNPSKD